MGVDTGGPGSGLPATTKVDMTGLTVRAAIAWGVLFLVFTAMTDIPATADVAALMAWLLFVSILLKYGPDAFKTITSVNTNATIGGTQVNPLGPA